MALCSVNGNFAGSGVTHLRARFQSLALSRGRRRAKYWSLLSGKAKDFRRVHAPSKGRVVLVRRVCRCLTTIVVRRKRHPGIARVLHQGGSRAWLPASRGCGACLETGTGVESFHCAVWRAAAASVKQASQYFNFGRYSLTGSSRWKCYNQFLGSAGRRQVQTSQYAQQQLFAGAP